MKKFNIAVAMMIGVLIAFANQSSAAPTDKEIKPEETQPVIPAPQQSYKPVVCQITSVVVDNLKNKYQELPVFFGNGLDQAGTSYIVSVNKENGAWTMLQFSPDKTTACVIGSGDGAKITVPDATQTKGTPILYKISN